MKAQLNKLFLALVLPGILIASSCKKEEKERPVVSDPPGEMKIQFNHVWGPENIPFELDKTYVHAKTGDSLRFTTLRYYVSNIKLRKVDGSWWSQPDSYYLVDMSIPNGTTLDLEDVPAGYYVEIQYTMGVDSEKNVTGAQTGALSSSNGMFWDWNSGYIMLKAEGYSPQAENNGFAFHLGGFSGKDNIVTTKSTVLSFSNDTIVIKQGRTPTVNIQANPAKLWHTAPSVSERATIHMPGEAAVMMAKDFYDNISYTGLTNK